MLSLAIARNESFSHFCSDPLGKDRSYGPVANTAENLAFQSGGLASLSCFAPAPRDPGEGVILERVESESHDWVNLRYKVLKQLSSKLYRDNENIKKRLIKLANTYNKNNLSEELSRINKENKPHSLCSCSKFIGYGKGNKRRDSIDVYYHAGENGEKGHFSYSGVQHCGGSLTCPVCGSIIAHKRQDEIKKCSEYLLNDGYNYLFWTLTARHDRSMSLGDFVKKFSQAINLLHAHRTYKEIRKRIGWEYHITASETKITDPLAIGVLDNGWHFHKHRIVFYKNNISKDDLLSMTDVISDLWCKCLERVGLSGIKGIASRFDVFEDANKVANEFIDKNSIEDNEERLKIIVNYISKAVSFEMASHSTKKDVENGKLGISDLMIYAAFYKNKVYFELYKEYLKGIKGVNFIRFSKGLKEKCGIEDKTDQDLLCGEKGDVKIYSFNAHKEKSGMSDFFYVAKQAAQNNLKQIMEKSLLNACLNGELESSQDERKRIKDGCKNMLEYEEKIKELWEDKVGRVASASVSVAVERAVNGLFIENGLLYDDESEQKFFPALASGCPACENGSVIWDRRESVKRVKRAKERVGPLSVAEKRLRLGHLALM